MSRMSGSVWGALPVLALISCGAQVEVEAQDDHEHQREDLCGEALSIALIEHSCSHLSHGPFQAVAISAGLAPPDVSTIHTAYDVAVMSEPGALHYRASREGRHVLFSDKPVLWAVNRTAGGAVSVDGVTVPTHPGSSAPLCPGVSHAAIVELHRGEDYSILAASPPSALSLFIEHTTAFGPGALEVSCE